MNKALASKSEIADLESFVFEELKKDYISDATNLNMPGLDLILTMLASKVVLPIVVSVAGRFAYDKIGDWRAGKIKKEDVIREAADSSQQNVDAVPQDQVISEIVADLQRDGVPAETAKSLAIKTYEKLNKSSTASPLQSP